LCFVCCSKRADFDDDMGYGSSVEYVCVTAKFGPSARMMRALAAVFASLGHKVTNVRGFQLPVQ
jgi:hypothetical protein